MLIPFDLALGLTTAVTVELAVRSWLARLRSSVLGAAALVALGLGIELARSRWPGGYDVTGDRLRAACAVLGALLSATLAYRVRGERSSATEPERAQSLGTVARSWLLLAALHAATCLIALDSGFGALLYLLGMLFACLLAVTLRLLSHAKRRRQADALFRAELARLLAVLCALAPLILLFLAARDGAQLGLGALLLLVLLVPFGTPLYARPPAPGSVPGPERWRRRVLATLALAALLPLALSVRAHVQHCAGALRLVPEPPAWRELALAASGDRDALGPFRLHAVHVEYKGYPAPFTDASLGDPGLCFDGTVSLAAWFAPSDASAMYRNPSELRLRRAQDAFVVSGVGWENDEQFVTAFQRVRSPHWAWDFPLSRWFELSALGLWFAAASVLAVERRWGAANAPRWATPTLAFRLLLPALLTVALLEVTLATRAMPRPGRELALEYVAP